MSTLAQRFGASFDELAREGAEAYCYEIAVGDMTREELLALIGWLGRQDLQSRRERLELMRGPALGDLAR